MTEPTIIIRNQRCYKGVGHYIGRPSGLGNPFAIGIHGGRDEVIEKYKVWLLDRLDSHNRTSKEFMELFDELCANNKLNLICFCAPKRCHGDVIRELLLQAWREEKGKR